MLIFNLKPRETCQGRVPGSVEPLDPEVARQKESFCRPTIWVSSGQCKSNRCGSASRWNKLHALRVLRRYNNSTLQLWRGPARA